MANVFAGIKSIDQSSGKTAGLKKVTKDMQTWRKDYKPEGATPTPAAPAAAKKPATPVKITKPAVCEERNGNWQIEYQTGPEPLTVSGINMKQQVYIFGCEGATILLEGKAKNIVFDSCKKTKLIFDNAVSSIEIVNCKGVQVQCKGVVPSVAIDKTDGCLVYISWEGREVQFVTSKSSEMNVAFPQGAGSDDYVEKPIPEQFVHKITDDLSISSDAIELTPPTLVVVEEQPTPVEDPPGPRTLISLEQLEQVHAAASAAERAERLTSALGVQHYPVNPRTCVWVDFCFGVLNFARDEAHLPPEKALALLTLAHEVYTFATDPFSINGDSSVSKISEPVPQNAESHEDAETAPVTTIPTPEIRVDPDAYPSVEAVYEQFHEKIRQASGVVSENDKAQDTETPSLPTPFSPMEVARIVTFFTSTFFRHLRAYQYVSRVQRSNIVRECPLPIETPLPPPSLADATLQTE
ncbi:hypothetical protein L915_02381 [Phytophthora nicotianae]|uniref:C-CAP/cofactor C-like domain-containing protein n=1 Tax=Phytophthora nicotianae TaxID=4792 RepID=W2HH73_PHYNI|nr:hypothetical protein L915_02381 [Phytophthora nicotianae]